MSYKANKTNIYLSGRMVSAGIKSTGTQRCLCARHWRYRGEMKYLRECQTVMRAVKDAESLSALEKRGREECSEKASDKVTLELRLKRRTRKWGKAHHVQSG